MQFNPKYMEESTLLYAIMYRKLINNFNDIQLVNKNPDLIIINNTVALQRHASFLYSTYPRVRKIFRLSDSICAKGYYTDHKRITLLKWSEFLHLKKNTLSKLEQLRVLLQKRQNHYHTRLPKIVRFLEKPPLNTFGILTNDVTEIEGAQRENLFSYPHFLDWDPQKIIAMHGKTDEQEREFACYIQKRHTPERKIFLDILSRYKKVDCFGHAGYNEPPLHITQDLPPPLKHETDTLRYKNRYYENHKIYQHYKFAIVFESSIGTDYITEKIVLAMLGGAIPIYWGTSSVDKYFNPGSFINYDNYESFTEMAKAVIALDQDEQRYWDMRRQPFFPNNQLPAIITDIRKNLDKFLDRALDL